LRFYSFLEQNVILALVKIDSLLYNKIIQLSNKWTVTILSNNTFFKPTPLYKEFMILDLIEKNKDITQREISEFIGVAVSMINSYIDQYEQKGYIKRKYLSAKTVEYFVTKKGIERRKLLNIEYLKASQILYSSAKENIEQFLIQIEEKGFSNILLYGAGEVAEILLQSIVIDKNKSVNILAVIDDDENKLGHSLVSTKIISLIEINDIKHDGILISSHTNKLTILNNLISVNYDETKIINFFEI
jgi:DNA-binding MarR family transcriptional regulator